MFYDIGEEVKLKVIQITFKTTKDINKALSMNKEEDATTIKDNLSSDYLMEILCTFNQEGLGPLKWWQS